MTHSCFWFPTCLVTTVLLGYMKKTTSLPKRKTKWQWTYFCEVFGFFAISCLLSIFFALHLLGLHLFTAYNLPLLWCDCFPVCSFFLCAARSQNPVPPLAFYQVAIYTSETPPHPKSEFKVVVKGMEGCLLILVLLTKKEKVSSLQIGFL